MITRQKIEDIHDKTLWVLKNVGIKFENEEIIELFSKRGFRTKGKKVYINRKEFEENTKYLSKNIEINGLNSRVNFDKEQIFSGSSGALRILESGEDREANSKDFIKMQKLNETSNILKMTNSNLIEVNDIPSEFNSEVKTALSLKITSKPLIGFASNKKEAENSIKLAKRFFGIKDKSYILGIANCLSPLKYQKDSIEAIQQYAYENQPINISACSMPGVSSPVTLLGTLVQNNAEVMAGIIMVQLLNPGNPVIYGNVSFGTDMRYASPAVGGIESSIIIPYIKGIADYYNMPCRAGGSFTDSKGVEWQAALESTISLYTAISEGTDLIYHAAGELDSLNMFSYEKYFLDEELIETIQRYLNKKREIGDNYCLDSIKNIGNGGQYLYEEDTLYKYKKEHFIPKFLNKDMYENWKMNGKIYPKDKTIEEMKKRLDEYKYPKLTREQEAILNPIIKEYMEW